MNASILVVGGNNFLATFVQLIQQVADFTLEVASDPDEAMPLIQAQQPDLLVMQAGQPTTLELCQQIKAQSRLSWIYCIIVANWNEVAEGRPPVESSLTSKLEFVESRANALETGADAYVNLSLDRFFDQELTEKLQAQWINNAIAQQKRLFCAYIRAGLRRVQNHRELMRTNDLLSAIALSDPLTELNNRRAFEWELPRQIHNARAREMPISLIMLDVDFFKSINDNYGHLVGDRALKLLSARLRHNLRFYDTPFRYGGEEFVVILSDTGFQEAGLIAQRLCRLIANQPFNISDTLDLTITVSAGAASLRDRDDAKGIDLLERADRNLLKAKSLGRNRVVCEEGGGERMEEEG
ncbi:MAG: diguanylate cyclase [Leptolyngbyaceae cyanobacterium RM2_2_4]|nr:diguanylate cyclase [Leptolyngbyaceae cyanobacterium RM2_2_4]